MNLNSEQYFSEIPQIRAPRSVFDRSFTHKTTMNVNKLYPIFIDECLPGDSVKLTFQAFGRLINPLIEPIMDELYLETIWGKSGMRLLWNNSFKFFGERENPNDSTDYVIPTINSGDLGFAVNSIFDHFGLPVNVPNLEVNSLPLRFYNRFYNEWLRDQNLINSVPVPLDDSDDSSNYTLLNSAKMHDLFTSALPSTQLGDAVNMPLSGVSAPVYGSGYQLSLSSGTSQSGLGYYSYNNDGTQIKTLRPMGYAAFSSALPQVSTSTNAVVPASWSDYQAIGVATKSQLTNSETGVVRSSGLYADLTSVTGVNVNDLRFLMKLQQYRERLMSGGHRYREIVSQFFNVDQLDNRAYNTEFLGMTREMIDVNTVVQTSSSDAVSPLGHLSAYAMFNSHESALSTSFVEHGYIMGLARIRHNPVYQQGLNKLWSRSTQLDFYNPMFNGLGEQPIKKKEIVCQGGNVLNASGEPIDDEAFGFNEAWYEYRYYPSLITGQLRSGISQSLDVYHLAQWFGSSTTTVTGTGTTATTTTIFTPVAPELNQSFIEENIPLDRVVSVETSDNTPQFVMDFRFEYITAREIPVRNIPAGLYSGI